MKFLLVLTVSFWTTFVVLGAHGYPQSNKQDEKSSRQLQQSFGTSSTISADGEDLATSGVDHQPAETAYGESYQQQEHASAFYPGYTPFENQPLGHSRPYVYPQQEGAYSQRAVSPYQQQLAYDTYREGRGGFVPSVAGGGTSQITAPSGPSSSGSYGILGSGNFGVIQGGTFYGDDEQQSSELTYDTRPHFSSFYRNGHGRPDYYDGVAANPHPQNHEQFANFRDFADINTPSYSEYVVVYANKNSSKTENPNVPKKPKNIIEQLAMLDLIDETNVQATTLASSLSEKPSKKLSKSKRKLALLPPEKKQKRRDEAKKAAMSADLNEPLLALS